MSDGFQTGTRVRRKHTDIVLSFFAVKLKGYTIATEFLARFYVVFATFSIVKNAAKFRYFDGDILTGISIAFTVSR